MTTYIRCPGCTQFIDVAAACPYCAARRDTGRGFLALVATLLVLGLLLAGCDPSGPGAYALALTPTAEPTATALPRPTPAPTPTLCPGCGRCVWQLTDQGEMAPFLLYGDDRTEDMRSLNHSWNIPRICPSQP